MSGLSIVFGLLTGFGVAIMLVVMLAGVFDPPPETIAIPAGNLLFVVAGAVLAATLVAFGFGRLHRRPNIVALKPQ